MAGRGVEMSSGRDTGLTAHLIALRSRLLKMVGTVALVFVILFPFAHDLYESHFMNYYLYKFVQHRLATVLE